MKAAKQGAVLALVALCGCGERGPSTAAAVLRDAGGREVGAARLLERRGGVVVRMEVRDLPPGLHGAHIHEGGECVPPDFISAGDHFDHSGAEHGHLQAAAHHAGDLPNLEVKPDGRGSIDVLVPGLTLKGNGPHSLFRDGNATIVIHEHPDDGVSQPSGNAGARIACGVIAGN